VVRDGGGGKPDEVAGPELECLVIFHCP
jgi:hypothetical protein